MKKLKKIDLATADTLETHSASDFGRKFVCPEESSWFAHSLERMVFNRFQDRSLPTIIEFGSGSGAPVVSAILNSGFPSIVHGYEINPAAAETAFGLISSNGLQRQYIIHNESFFEDKGIPKADYLIANPPYLPAVSCA